MVLLREIEVENIVRGNLAKNGFDVFPRPKPHGVDIIAQKNNVLFYIEVEGNIKPDKVNPLTTSQKYTHYFRAIGQILSRISTFKKGVFIIALPEDEYYRKKVEGTIYALKKLGVIVYFVTKENIKIIE